MQYCASYFALNYRDEASNKQPHTETTEQIYSRGQRDLAQVLHVTIGIFPHPLVQRIRNVRWEAACARIRTKRV
jgi:hypothetical protein